MPPPLGFTNAARISVGEISMPMTDLCFTGVPLSNAWFFFRVTQLIRGSFLGSRPNNRPYGSCFSRLCLIFTSLTTCRDVFPIATDAVM